MSEKTLLVHVARFARALREREIPANLADQVDAVTALTLVDLSDRAEVRQALRVALKVRHSDAEAFDELFDRLWASEPAAAAPANRSGRPFSRRAAPLARLGAAPAGASSAELEREVAEGDLSGYSPEALLRRKPFEACTEADLIAMERILARMAFRLATRRSRRLVPARARGTADLRRSFRKAVATDGEFLRLARRARAVEEPRLVVLCDTSGSMDSHTRFLLCFLLALKRAARRTEIFVFNTELTRLTPWISPAKIAPTLERLAAQVPDWSGGTRIGESLGEFVARYLDEMVDGKTVAIIVSDGLDRGDTAVLAGAMRAIRSRARRVIWLNPLLGDPRYEPTARGMEAALPFVDLFAPAHNLESLERLLPQLAA
ncbi:MAG: vWA domain-containing protein [Thermoanaerobaculia bacterium]